jgi:hypothetical protein
MAFSGGLSFKAGKTITFYQAPLSGYQAPLSGLHGNSN